MRKQIKISNYDLILELLYSVSINAKETPQGFEIDSRTLSNYRNFTTFPPKEKIIPLARGNHEKLKKLDPYEVDPYLLLIYVNAENNKKITSNEKKIISLLTLGSEESVDPEHILFCDSEKDRKLFSYFKRLNVDKKNKLKYLPGRSLMRYQIWNLGDRYDYTKSKVNKALKSLAEKGFIEYFPVNESKQNKYDRFKLSVQGCADYLRSKESI